MKNAILSFLCLLSLHVAAQVPTDPVLRIDYNLRNSSPGPIKKGLSDENYTAAEKEKLAGIPAGGGSSVAPSINVGSIASGSTAGASITGNNGNYLLNLVLPKGDPGAQGPQGIQGVAGQVGPQGATGPTGPQGLSGNNGLDGKTVLNGTAAPSSGIGVNGDFYINTQTNTLYGPKSGGAWPSGVSLVGPAGSGGSTPIANNLTTTTTGSALDASQGKALKDLAIAAARDSAAAALAKVPQLEPSEFGLNGSGNIVAQPPFSRVQNKPTTVAGYGITDALTQAVANTLYRAIGTAITFAELSGKPTTKVGYGITDIYTKTEADAASKKTTSDSMSTFVPGAGIAIDYNATTRTGTIRATGSTTTDATPTANSTNPVQSGGVFSSQQTQNNNIAANTTALASATATIAALQATIADLQATQSTNLARLNSIEQQLAQTSTVASPTLAAGTITSTTAGVVVTQAGSATSTTVYVSANSAFTSGVFSRSVTASGTASFTNLAPSTLYYARANSLGTSGPASPYSTTISFTTSASVASVNSVTVTNFPSMQDLIVSTNGTGGTRFTSNPQRTGGASDHAVLSNLKITPGQSATITMTTTLTSTLGGTAYMALDSNNSINTGNGAYKHTTWTNYNGSIFQVQSKSVNVFQPSPPTIAAGSTITNRIVVYGNADPTKDSVGIDYTINGGTTWIVRQKKPKYATGVTPYDMYFKFDHISGINNPYAENIVVTGGTAVTLTTQATPTLTITGAATTSTSFQAVASNVGADSYKFDVSTSADFSTGTSFQVSNSASTTLNRSGLVSGTTYYIRVKAYKQGQIDSGYAYTQVTLP